MTSQRALNGGNGVWVSGSFRQLQAEAKQPGKPDPLKGVCQQ